VSFPIVLSNGPPDAAGLKTVSDAGVTTIRTGRGDWAAAQLDAQIAQERARLDAAHTAGLTCWVWLGALTNLGPNASDANLRQVVNALHDHPALGAWKGHDEPRNPFTPSKSVPADNLARGHRVIASIDGAHPVVIIQAPRGDVNGLIPYRPAFDITGADIYPVGYPPGTHSDRTNADLSVVGDVTQWIRKAAGTKPVWMTLQIAWSGVLPPDHVPRFPSNADLRFMAYQAIANGARGLAFFGGHLEQVMTPADAATGWNWTYWRETLQPVVSELASTALAPALTASPSKANVRTSPKVPGVEIATREAGGFLYVFAARRSGTTSQVGFAGIPTSVTAGQVLFEYANGEFRSFPVSRGAFRDWFAPHDAHVYRFKL
jgi:hypothetical protein